MEDMELPELPEQHRVFDCLSAFKRGAYSHGGVRAEIESFARDYARQAVLRERERNKALMEKCADIAEWHIADRDECGVLAREVYEAIRKGSQ